ncbi:MAG: alginate export family protein, partial [Candidatus Omnitrophica bacterium]|nr:alginate export family protein [Candidatus Omnitrophota bacterium]
MSKRLIVVLALALVVGLTFSAAYAEVQNVKVSGDLNFLGAIRNNFSLRRGNEGNRHDNDESFFATQARVRIDADLTDNVAATVRLINERKWGNNNNSSNSETGIDLDLAYVTLKEFLYSPLSFTIGRQELMYGNKLILGNRGISSKRTHGLPTDLSSQKSFDSIKAVFNYDPLVVDLIYSKISETSSRGVKDDANLFGIYGSYDINKNLKADLYGFYKGTKNKKDSPSATKLKGDQIYTIGTLIIATPIKNLKTSLEAALQFGRHRENATNPGDKQRKAWALQAMADYTFADTKYVPSIGASFIHLSGDKASTDTTSGKRGWDSMYYDQALNSITHAIIPFTNLNVLNLRGSMKPADDITLSANYGFYMRDRKSGNMASPA